MGGQFLQSSAKSLGQNGNKAREHEDAMVKVKECLQARHGFETQEECQWTLVPPTNVNGFVSGKIWAIARVGDTSDVRTVEKQRLHTLSSDEARAKYSDIAGSLALFLASTVSALHRNAHIWNASHPLLVTYYCRVTVY